MFDTPNDSKTVVALKFEKLLRKLAEWKLETNIKVSLKSGYVISLVSLMNGNAYLDLEYRIVSNHPKYCIARNVLR